MTHMRVGFHQTTVYDIAERMDNINGFQINLQRTYKRRKDKAFRRAQIHACSLEQGISRSLENTRLFCGALEKADISYSRGNIFKKGTYGCLPEV